MTASLNASTSSGVVVTSDTSGDIAIQSNGTTKFTVASTGAYGQIVSGTTVASTSGTSIDFTSIPSWAKRITIMFNGVSHNTNSSLVLVQIGAGSVTTSGYASGAAYVGTGSTGATNATNGFAVANSSNAPDALAGTIFLNTLGSNIWVCSGTLAITSSAYAYCFGGNITLGGTLDRVRITTSAGTATFDAGSINILYEG